MLYTCRVSHEFTKFWVNHQSKSRDIWPFDGRRPPYGPIGSYAAWGPLIAVVPQGQFVCMIWDNVLLGVLVLEHVEALTHEPCSLVVQKSGHGPGFSGHETIVSLDDHLYGWTNCL